MQLCPVFADLVTFGLENWNPILDDYKFGLENWMVVLDDYKV